VGSFQSRASSERRLDPSAPLRRRILLGTTAVAALMAAGFAVVHFMRDRPELGYFSLSALLACGVLVGVLHFTRGHRPAVLVATLYAAGVTLFLLAWGRAPAGDFVWTLLVPPMIAYAGGRRLACWLLPSYLLSAAVIVLWPGFSRHALWNELELTLRYLGLLVLLSAVSYLYELTRNRAQQELEAQVREREAAERRLEQANARLIEAAEQAANLAAQAQAANLAKTRFLSHMSHDIRTPLTGIVGMASVLELTELTPHQRTCVHTIQVSGETLTSLIGDILDLARIDAGRVQLRPVAVELATLMDEVWRVLAPQADDKGLRFEAELDPALPQRLVVDRTRLERVLLNLAGNAIKFTNRGRVDLRLRGHPDDPRWWRVEVQDTGIGIAPGQHRRIFDSFTQVDLSSTRRQGGTGLGLAIVSRLVALMGGELGLDSDEGVGSTFWVDLPIVEPGELDEAPPTEDELPSLDPRRLLVVDDNEIVRQVLCALLRHDGHSVEEASDGAQALERLALREFDAVLMDVQMPRLDGMEATRRLRRGEGGVLDPSVPVVGVTALADTDTRQACEHAGMDAVLTKPVHPRTLVATLARVLQDPRG
jgi:signal transduction histidine kinase/ActR/RegA family two-component response regulator